MANILNTLVSWQPYYLPNETETMTFGVGRTSFPVNTVTLAAFNLPIMYLNQHVTIYAPNGSIAQAPAGTTIAGASSYTMAAGETQTFYYNGYGFSIAPAPVIPIPPAGYLFLTDRNGAYLTDNNSNYLIAHI